MNVYLRGVCGVVMMLGTSGGVALAQGVQANKPDASHIPFTLPEEH